MYIPVHFREDRIEVLHQLIYEHSLATLVTLGNEGLVANHVPLVFDPRPGPLGTLRGHLSRHNPQWNDLLAGTQALAIFQGPSAYITPSWYATRAETGKVVPTFNYIAVHVYGAVQVFDDLERLEASVHALTEHHESVFATRWKVEQAPADFIKAQLKGIVGIEIPIAKIEGKWKVSQNRPLADRQGAIDGLRAQGDPASLAMADWIERENQ